MDHRKFPTQSAPVVRKLSVMGPFNPCTHHVYVPRVSTTVPEMAASPPLHAFFLQSTLRWIMVDKLRQHCMQLMPDQ